MLATAALMTSSISYADADDKYRSHSSGMRVKVQIEADGDALVRGAKVTSVTDTQVNANTSLGSSVLSWIVKTEADTDYSAPKGGASGRSNIAIGDIISFRGTLDQSVSGLTVRADQVKDWTSVETKAKLTGIVSSINTTLSSFNISHKNGTTTVQTSSSTKFTEDGERASFSDIVLNARVKLAGMFNASTTVFSATSVEIDEDEKSDDTKKRRGWLNGKAWFKIWHKDD